MDKVVITNKDLVELLNKAMEVRRTDIANDSEEESESSSWMETKFNENNNVTIDSDDNKIITEFINYYEAQEFIKSEKNSAKDKIYKFKESFIDNSKYLSYKNGRSFCYDVFEEKVIKVEKTEKEEKRQQRQERTQYM